MLITNMFGKDKSLYSSIDPISESSLSKVFLDGWMDHDAPESKTQAVPVGVFNRIEVWPSETRFEITNDPFGQRQLFFHLQKGAFAISDNFWTLLSLLPKYSIDWDAVKENVIAVRLSIPFRTYVKDVYVVPAGVVVRANWRGETHFEIQHHSQLHQVPNDKLRINDAVSQTIESLDATIQAAERFWPGYKLIFGNSGGLDSRLIPVFARRNGVEVEGYFVGQKKLRLLKSRSVRSADLIARRTGYKYRILPYDRGDAKDRIERDVFVNPLGPANHFRNAGYKEFQGALVLNAADSFVITNDSNKWRAFIHEKTALNQLLQAYMLRPSLRSERVSGAAEYTSRIQDYLQSYIPVQGNFSLIRTLHQSFWNKVSPNGGFESMSRTGDFLFVYYPYLWSKTLQWQPDWFFDRQIQTRLFERVAPRIGRILSQIPKAPRDARKAESLLSRVEHFLARADYRFRLSGIDYSLWEQGEWFQQANRILEYGVDGDFKELVNEVALPLERDCWALQDYYDLLKIGYTVRLLQERSSPNQEQA